MTIAANVIIVVLVLGTLAVHLGNYRLRQQKDWRAKGLLALGLILSAGIAAQYYVNHELAGPRSLSARQQDALVRTLSPYAGQAIFLKTNVDDPEAVALANQLLSVLRQAHWSVEIWRNMSEARDVSGLLVEQIIPVPAPAEPVIKKGKEAAKALVQALRDVSLQTTGPQPLEIGNPTALIRLTIGRKP